MLTVGRGPRREVRVRRRADVERRGQHGAGRHGGQVRHVPGTLMPGPGSGASALFGTDGSGPNVRSGSGAGAQGGPAEAGAALARRPGRLRRRGHGRAERLGRGRLHLAQAAAALPAPGGGPGRPGGLAGPGGGASWDRLGPADAPVTGPGHELRPALLVLPAGAGPAGPASAAAARDRSRRERMTRSSTHQQHDQHAQAGHDVPDQRAGQVAGVRPVRRRGRQPLGLVWAGPWPRGPDGWAPRRR